jgi:hypothetical protein
MPKEIQAGAAQGFLLTSKWHSVFISDIPHTPALYMVLLADDTYMYATDRNRAYVSRNLQRAFSLTEIGCESRRIANQ